jgi:anti-sigma-K factor RskA
LDLSAYIASGVLESYVLGAASTQEQQEVECLSKIYPEIKEALSTLQNSMEELALANAIAPPAHLKSALLEKIEHTPQEASPALPRPVTVVEEKKTGMSIAHSNVSWFYKVGIAASLLIAVGFASLWYSSIQKNLQTQSDLAAFKSSQEVMQSQLAAMQQGMEEAKLVKYLMAHKATQLVALPGTPNNPAAAARVYWNTSTKDVLLTVDALPEPPSDKQYQLWAIVNGQPMDMGVFDMDQASNNVLYTRHKAEVVQAFAITLEPRGGNKAPTLETMQVMGKI